MFNVKSFDEIFFYRPNVDFRKGIDGLCAVVQDEMKLDPYKKYLFIFSCNGHRKIKILYWDKSGFVLWYKRLEEDKYRWPVKLEKDVIRIDKEKLNDFLIGLDLWQMPHRELNYS
jgi:transposase